MVSVNCCLFDVTGAFVRTCIKGARYRLEDADPGSRRSTVADRETEEHLAYSLRREAPIGS